MAVSAEQLGTAFSLAQVALLFATAVYVWALRPSSWPKRAFALVLALRGTAQLAGFAGLIAGTAPADATASYWSFVDMGLLHMLAVAAFATVWPARVRWRSISGALLATGWAAFLVQAAGLTFARPAFYLTTLGAVAYWAAVAGFAAIALSCVLRLDAVPPVERRWASVVVFVACGSVFALPTYSLGVGLVGVARGGPFVSIGEGSASLAAIAFLLVVFAIVPAATLLWWRRERHGILLLAGLYGAATVPFAFYAGMPYYFFTLIEAILALHIFARGASFGVGAPPRGAAFALSIVASASFFLAIVALSLSNFGDASLSLVAAVLAGLVLGGLALAATLPRDALARGDAGEESTRRLSAYGIALERELSAGRSPDEAGAALADLRAALRVSDDEHAALVSTRAPAVVGQGLVLGRYRPLRVLGEGGGGVTRLCLDERVGREVVLKSLRSADAGAERMAFLLREARATGAVKHPNVITVHDVIDSRREVLIVMEHAERGSLRDALAHGPLSPDEWRRVADGLLRALEAVHAAGVIHRDVKPSNVLLMADGTPKLADFGIASVPGFETTVGGLGDVAVGTFRYMSPEQAKGRPATARSDLFSAGATLYEALSGAPYLAPRAGESAVEVQMRAASAGPFDRPVAKQPLRAWFARALDPEAAGRFASAREMREALEVALA